MMMDWRQAAEKVGHELIGTCQTLDSVLEKLELDGADNVIEFCDALDTIVFCCTVCDWWYDTGDTGNDVNGQWACVECGGEIE